MSAGPTVSRTMDAPAERVFDVLADGWNYAGWVVGASHIRDVDPGWPAAGTRIHHSVGPWPFAIRDTTEVLAVEPGRMLLLRVRFWPLGSGTVRLDIEPRGTGTSYVRMTEHVDAGPVALLPRPAQTLVLRPRNDESLRRLEALVVRGRIPGGPGA
ncbi:MAG TPA: SRPBCC family protein [Pseudonocardiaceae bacterium]